jgi:hypothetical protein
VQNAAFAYVDDPGARRLVDVSPALGSERENAPVRTRMRSQAQAQAPGRGAALLE